MKFYYPNMIKKNLLLTLKVSIQKRKLVYFNNSKKSSTRKNDDVKKLHMV